MGCYQRAFHQRGENVILKNCVCYLVIKVYAHILCKFDGKEKSASHAQTRDNKKFSWQTVLFNF
jgi:hypothetical protein